MVEDDGAKEKGGASGTRARGVEATMKKQGWKG